MALILSIESSTMVCSAAIHQDGELLASQVHQVEKSHSSLLPSILLDICAEASISPPEIDAVAVSGGPGSYTGLRIGCTTAKGICFALDKKLLAIPSLDIMAEAVRGNFSGEYYLAPMMDARRMEVYIHVEDQHGHKHWDLQPLILEEHSFHSLQKPLYLFGDGMPKFKPIARQKNIDFIDDIFPSAENMGRLAWEKYKQATFEDIAYYQPNYLKKWRTTTPKKQLL